MEQFNIKTDSKKTFVLFHGTGGNEYSLIQLAGDLDATASIVSYIGDVGEGKTRRFNLPLENGQLNREDFEMRVNEFLQQWHTQPLTGELTFIGYSNGANFILGLLEKEPAIAKNIVLLKPTNLNYHFEQGSEAAIIMTVGALDQLSIAGDTVKLVKQMQMVFPNVQMELFDHGHEIKDVEIDKIRALLTNK